MAKFTFTEKQWDSIRPSSVKKTGVGDGIKNFLKLVPGAHTEGLATPASCVKAQEALVELEKTLSTALAAVKKASDDKKGAAAELKTWVSEADAGIEAIKTRKIALVEAETEPVRKKWTAPLKDLEQKVQGVVAEIKSADSDAGRAEELLREAMMAMAERGGELRSTGHTGLKPRDFLDDGEFKKAYEFYSEQVDIITRSNKTLELVAGKQSGLKKLIEMMWTEVRAAALKAGDYINLPSDNLRAFKKLRVDAEAFWSESCSDNARMYASFCFLADFTPSKDVRPKFDDILLKRFAELKKIDAEAYFEKELAMHGLSQKQLTKTLSAVKGAGDQVRELVKAIGEGKGDVGGDKKKLKQIAETVDVILKKHQKGRNNLDMIQFLSKPHNADAKKFIDNAIQFMQKTSEDAARAVEETA